MAAKYFTIPAIEIIKPKIAVCLGYDTFTAIKIACGFPNDAPMEKAISYPFIFNETKIFCQAHTSQRGINNRNRGKINRVENDWKLMAQYFYQ